MCFDRMAHRLNVFETTMGLSRYLCFSRYLAG